MLDFQTHRLVVDMDKARQRFDCSSHGWLLANDEPNGSKRSQAAPPGYSQREILDACLGGGNLE